MRKIIISEFLTVDGMIADPAGKMDWAKDLFNDEMLKEISNRRKQVDTLLLGRHTYEMMEKYCAGVLPVTEDRATIRYMNSVSKFVFSKTLPVLKWNNATLIKEINKEEIRNWQQQPGKDLAIIGSASIAQAFINLGLVDEYQFLIHPLMLAGGKPLFKNIQERHSLKQVKTETYKNGVVCLCYQSSTRS